MPFYKEFFANSNRIFEGFPHFLKIFSTILVIYNFNFSNGIHGIQIPSYLVKDSVIWRNMKVVQKKYFLDEIIPKIRILELS